MNFKACLVILLLGSAPFLADGGVIKRRLVAALQPEVTNMVDVPECETPGAPQTCPLPSQLICCLVEAPLPHASSTHACIVEALPR